MMDRHIANQNVCMFYIISHTTKSAVASSLVSNQSDRSTFAAMLVLARDASVQTEQSSPVVICPGCMQKEDMSKKLQEQFAEFHSFSTTRFCGQQADPIASCTADQHADHARYGAQACILNAEEHA